MFEVVLAAEECWNSRLVETVAWIHRNASHRVRAQPGKYLNTAKSDILIFRRCQPRSAGRRPFKLELRQQRTPDVCLEPVRRDPATGGEVKPDEWVYATIETLLPHATKRVAGDKGAARKLLHLLSRRPWNNSTC